MRQRVNDETLTQVNREKIDLEQRLQAKHLELVNQRYQFTDQIKQLTDHNESLRRQLESVGRKLKAANDELADLEEVRSQSSDSTANNKLPEPAELLNQFRKKSPKSKISLREVEVLLNLL